MANTQQSHDEMKPGWGSLAAEVAGADAAHMTQEIKAPSNAGD